MRIIKSGAGLLLGTIMGAIVSIILLILAALMIPAVPLVFAFECFNQNLWPHKVDFGD